MKYIKRTYSDVRDSFEWENSGKSMFIRWSTVGVNSTGIWLQPFTNDQPYGFFEWEWIKEVLVSSGDEIIYFVMKDMDSVYENVILWKPKFLFKTAMNKLKNGDKAFRFPYRVDSLTALQYALDQGWVDVISIE